MADRNHGKRSASVPIPEQSRPLGHIATRSFATEPQEKKPKQSILKRPSKEGRFDLSYQTEYSSKATSDTRARSLSPSNCTAAAVQRSSLFPSRIAETSAKNVQPVLPIINENVKTVQTGYNNNVYPPMDTLLKQVAELQKSEHTFPSPPREEIRGIRKSFKPIRQEVKDKGKYSWHED